jgi:hypothetical protein
MSNTEFKPKIGKSRASGEFKFGRLTRMVVKAATRQRAQESPWANALTRRPVAELGRGKGALYGLTPPPQGWRRVIVKVRIARHGTSDLAAARSHQHYIMRDGVTRDGGPEHEYERLIKLANEMKAEQFTSLDRGILKDAQENVLAVSAMVDDERGKPALRMGRLRRLEQMGLAEEKQTGVWVLDPQLEPKLRSIGERGDIMVTMNQLMREHGINRPAGDFAIFSGARKAEPVIGRVVEVGIADEMTDCRYLVVDDIDGRVQYAETGKLAAHDMPEQGMIVALSGGGGSLKVRNAQIEIVSYWPLQQLRSAEAATWLDQAIVAEAKPVIHDNGFGAEVSKAIVAREEWLIATPARSCRAAQYDHAEAPHAARTESQGHYAGRRQVVRAARSAACRANRGSTHHRQTGRHHRPADTAARRDQRP